MGVNASRGRPLTTAATTSTVLAPTTTERHPQQLFDVVNGKTIRIRSHIPYAHTEGVDPYSQTLDWYTPVGDADLPVLVFVHGGGWTGGDKYFADQGRYFASKGVVVASVNYRLQHMTRAPNACTDIAAALKVIRETAADHGGNAQNIILMGHSAGAHLAALCVADPRYLDEETAKAIRGVILLDGSAYHVPEMMRTWRGPLYTDAFPPDRDLWYEVSPYHYAIKRTALPSFLMVHADGDRIRYQSAKRFADAVRRGGGTARLVAAPDEDHISLQENLAKPGNPLTVELLGFIRELHGK